MDVVGHCNEAGSGTSVKKKREANEINDSTKFIQFLSTKCDDEQQEGSDLLYLVIDDIVSAMMIFTL